MGTVIWACSVLPHCCAVADLVLNPKTVLAIFHMEEQVFNAKENPVISEWGGGSA